MEIRELIKQLSQLPEEKKGLPLYVSNEEGDNFKVESLSLYDEYAPHSEENPLGANFKEV